jgi:hypothetical protein
MSDAFAPIVRARPDPTFGRPVRHGVAPHRLRPGTTPHALRIPPHGGHPALRVTRGGSRSPLAVSGFRLRARVGFSIPSSPRPARNYPRFRIRRPSSGRRRDLNPPDHHAAQRTLQAHPPLDLASVLSASGDSPLRLFPSHRGSRFPGSLSEPGSESRHLNAGRHAGSKRISPALIPEQRLNPGFDVVPTLSTLRQWFTCVRLSDPHLTRSCRAFCLDAHDRSFWLKPLKGVCSLPPQTGCEGPTLISNRHGLAHSRQHTASTDSLGDASPDQTESGGCY